MKSKPIKQKTMDEFVADEADRKRKRDGKISVGYRGGDTPLIKSTSTDFMINDKHQIEYENKIKNYNSNVTKLNPLYSDLTPTSKVLVRCFHLETKRAKNGLIIPPKLTVKVPTQNGVGTLQEVDSDWKYSRKAVVVCSASKSFNPGDIITLETNHLRPVSTGKGMALMMPNSYTHPEHWPHEEPPKDITNEHFGYLLIRPSDIEMILHKTNKDDVQ